MQLHINFNALDEPVVLEGLTSFVIQNKAMFAHVVQELFAYEQDETDENRDIRLFTETYKALKPSELMVVTDILSEDLNTATVLKLIYADLEKSLSLNPEVKTKIEDLLGEVWSLINQELVDFELDLDSRKMEIQEAFKGFGIRVETKSRCVFEKVLEIIQLFKYLSKKRVLIFVNLGTYLTTDEMASVVDYTKMQGITVILFDTHTFDVPVDVKRIEIDEDFVVM